MSGGNDTTRIPSYGDIRSALDELPDAVRAIRRIRSLSTRAAAAEMGVSFASVYRFEDRDVGGYNSTTLIAVLDWLDRQRPEATP